MKAKELNPRGTLLGFGDGVRVERGIDNPKDPNSGVCWIVFEKVDVSDDPDTSYEYRFEEVERFPEKEPGVCPDEAIARAEALAS